MQIDHYTYRITWFAESPEATLQGTRNIMSAGVADMRTDAPFYYWTVPSQAATHVKACANIAVGK